jgi:hypothetical protein
MGMNCLLRAIRFDEPKDVTAVGTANRSPIETESSLSLEKSWHGLHFLLTRSAGEPREPLGFLLEGGEQIGAFDPFNGPGTRLFDAKATEELDDALAEISDDLLWQHFDASQMTAERIYPNIWDEPEADLRAEYIGYFRALKDFVHQARISKSGLEISVG